MGLLVAAHDRRIVYICPPNYNEAYLSLLRACEARIVEFEIPAITDNLKVVGAPVSDAQLRQLVALTEGSRTDPHVTFSTMFIKAPFVPQVAGKAASDLELRHGAFTYDIEHHNGHFSHVKRRSPGIALRTFDFSQVPNQAGLLYNSLSWLREESRTFGESPHCRIALVALPENLLLFVLSIDHVFSDLFSARVALSDFVYFYRRHLGHNVSPPQQPMPYEDHVRRILHPKSADLKFWSLYLAGGSQPNFQQKSQVISFETRAYRFEVGAEIYEEMKRLAREAKSTIFAVALAKIFIILRRITGQIDIAIGFVSSNRDVANRDLVALVADTVFVRAQSTTELDAAYVSYISASHRAAFQHALTPRSLITAVTGLGVPLVVVNFMSEVPRRQSEPPRQTFDEPAISLAQAVVKEIFQEERKLIPQALFIELADAGSDLHVKILFNPNFIDQDHLNIIRNFFCR